MNGDTVRDVETTVVDLSAKVRESVLAGNAAGATDWASALRDACAALRDLEEIED